ETMQAVSWPPLELATNQSMGPPHVGLYAGEIFFVDIDFEEAGKPLEVAVRFDVADDGDERCRIDELFELDVVKLKLAGDGDHHPIKTLLDKGAVGADPELAAEHHVERQRLGATRFIAELQRCDFTLLPGLSRV